VAVPGLDVYDVLRSPYADADFEVVVVKDATGQRWIVRAPNRAAAGAAIEAEMGVLRALVRAHDGGLLSFTVPSPAGSVAIGDGSEGRAVVYSEVRGAPLSLAHVEQGPGLAASIGRCIAELHELPHEVIEDTGLPVYSAEEFRDRRMNELDAGIQTGKVPPRLADRWEHQLENVAWWKFEPTVCHGDLGEHQVVIAGDSVAGVMDWMDAHVGDPADDLAWLVASAPEDVLDSVMEAYTVARRELRDAHLLDRARLSSEMALLRWLMFGVRADDAGIIADGEGMLADLDALLFDED
jgi:aminoglycoside phosphotransferase (APT) family kinase protein